MLGGFDGAMVVDESLVVADTRWADGSLHESVWDIFKLGSALAIPRVDAAVVIYAAPAKHWDRPDSCARLFEDREVCSRQLICHLPRSGRRTSRAARPSVSRFRADWVSR